MVRGVRNCRGARPSPRFREPDGGTRTSAPSVPAAARSESAPARTRPVLATGIRERELAFTSYLRVAAMVAVVLIHTLATIVGDDAQHGATTWWIAAALDLGSSWAVPVFIMVSGALLLEPDGLGAAAFYRRRLRRIAIPLVVAHVGYLALRAATGETLTPSSVIHDLLAATVYTQLYFFWIILGLYLVTPLLRDLLHGGSARRPVVVGLAATAWMVLVAAGGTALDATGQPVQPWQPAAITLWVPYVGYFVLGYALRHVILGRSGLAAAVLAFLAGAGLATWYYATAGSSLAADIVLGGGYQGIPIAVSAVALFLIGRSLIDPAGRAAASGVARVMRTLGSLTLGVFVVHLAILRLVRAAPGFGRSDVQASLPLDLVQFVVVLVVSFALCAAIARVPILRRSIGM